VTLLTVFALAVALIGLAVLAMAVGVIFRRPCLRGSCGGTAVADADGQRLDCAACPNRRRKAAPG
jgi:hypothetical protein